MLMKVSGKTLKLIVSVSLEINKKRELRANTFDELFDLSFLFITKSHKIILKLLHLSISLVKGILDSLSLSFKLLVEACNLVCIVRSLSRIRFSEILLLTLNLFELNGES